MSDSILLSIDAGLARVTFNRPTFLNAMDFEMGTRWRDIAHQVTADDSVGAIILDAAGPAFCAGGDVVAMATSGATGAELSAMADIIHDGIRTFVESDKPIVTAAHGAVAGGGIGLMLTGDYVVAAEGTKFVSKYANIGLSPDLGVSTLLPAAIGRRRALELLLQDRTLDAETAREWGLVAEVVADPSARAQEIARSWLDGATAAYGQAKRLIHAGARRTLSENLDDEAATIGARFETDEAKARVAAFAAASRKQAVSKEQA
ncbi:enoyl-CoA hydratase/isomerase family protein [Microbacterium koreense]|uniref:Enoyl-CoA hydratase/isomerase family protein n=1 Tax=Microbacterium koreense TaxID=323761 RepID=A0ABW2ZMW6_9MICO